MYMQYAMTIYVEPALPRVVPNLPLPLLLLIVKILEHKMTSGQHEARTKQRVQTWRNEGTEWQKYTERGRRRRSMTMKYLACRGYCLSPWITSSLFNLAIRPNGDCWRFLMRGSVLYIASVTGMHNILGGRTIQELI